MKEIILTEGQVWKTYEFDPSLIVRGARASQMKYAINTKPVHLYPDFPGSESFIWSNDPRVANYKVRVAEEADTKCPADIDEEGYASRNGVIGNFHACCTDNEIWPRTIPPLPDNSAARAELKLRSKWKTPRHKLIFEKLARLMTARWIPGNIRIARYSSSGPPHMTINAEEKKNNFLPLLANIERVLTLIGKRDLLGLFHEFAVLIAFRVGARRQADKWDLIDGHWRVKPRLVPDIEYALSNGKKGSIHPAENTCLRDMRLALSRVRTFYGMTNLVNLLIAVFFDGFRNGVFTEYAATFKQHGPPDIEAKLNKWRHHVSIDVSNHDFLIPRFIADVLFDRLREVLDPRVVDLIILAWQAPIFTPWPDTTVQHPPFWIGHPLLIDTFQHWFGLPSGHYLVDFFGKFGNMGCYLCKTDDMGIEAYDNMEEILKWQDPDIGFLDQGDDAVANFDRRDQATRFRDVLDIPDYYKTGVEPNGYLGNTIFKDHIEDRKVHVSPSAVSLVVNPMVRERNLDSRFSPFWAKGFDARQAVYRPIPAYSDLTEITTKAFRDIFGYDLETAIKAHSNYKKALPDLTWADRLLLDDPEKIHYRFQPGDLTPSIENMFSAHIEPAEYEKIVKPYIHRKVRP